MRRLVLLCIELPQVIERRKALAHGWAIKANFGNAFFPTLIRVSHYICKNCGFAELWVDRDDDLQDLRVVESMS
jgi:hypothetical protein